VKSDNILDALMPADASPADTLYVADRDLKIVQVNEEWREFARANNGARLLGEGWNPQLLANFSGSEKIRWTGIYKALLSGRLPFHEENFQCPSPIERRTYKLRIMPHRDETGAVAYLAHHAVRTDKKPPAPSCLKERLEALDGDPQVTVEAYRAHVMGRLIRPIHFRTAQHFQPLEEVGGDLLWTHEYADGSTDLVLADVMGHGLEAARLAAKLVFLLESITETRQGIPQNVARLNRLLLELLQGSTEAASQPLFATGLYLRMSPGEQALTVCSFGHSGPIFSKVGHIVIEGGMPVGLMEQIEPWPEVTLSLATHGRRFLLFTDGVTEQFNLEGEMFGEAALEREFNRTLELPLPQMLEHTCACVEAFRGQALVKDDQTLLGLESIA
jgi:hypothetical protein